VIQTSQEARSVDCGDLTNQRGEMVCSPLGQPTSSCHVTAGSRLAELEQENQDLQVWVREGKCGSGWSSWGSWSSCDSLAGSCPTNQVHCKDTVLKIRCIYPRNGTARLQSQYLHSYIHVYLCAIYIFPRSVCVFCCRKIGGPIVGIYSIKHL
jgi:hypothetical protein